MCSRFSQKYRVELAAKWRKVRDPKGLFGKWEPLKHVAPTDASMVIIEEEGEARWDQMIFGLVPHWAKDVKMGLHCRNARAETVAEKPSFRVPFKKQRCLIPADGYYEWEHIGKKRIPYFYSIKERPVFAFAGLWDEWTSPTGLKLRSFAIITTEPNALVAPVNDRMPVILPSDAEDRWLAGAPDNPSKMLDLLKPFPPEQMNGVLVGATSA